MGNSNSGYHDYYVYDLAYPESMGGHVFYVGKGRLERINDHEKEARRGHQCKKCEIIRSIWLVSEQVIKTKRDTGLSETDALILERKCINQYPLDALMNSHMQYSYKSATPEWRLRRSHAAKKKWEELKTQSWWLKKHPPSP